MNGSAAQATSLNAWHAMDAPFADPDDWADALIPGICTACGTDAYRGHTRWWHIDFRLCPDRARRTPGFAPDKE